MAKAETEILAPDQGGVARAAGLLRAGRLVGFPTETVYGLGADARDDKAVARIFAAKQRPAFNPLIVHVVSQQAAGEFVVFNAFAERLADAFWPGPLTLVLPLRAGGGISPLVCAGLPSLAIRVPAQPLAQALLAEFGGPVAAPSANLSGRISPTSVAHVASGMSGRIAAILDGGPCAVGLESTIVGFGPEPVLLRPGGLPVEIIEQCLGQPLAAMSPRATPDAPGQLASHYAPRAGLLLNVDDLSEHAVSLGFGAVGGTLNLSPSGDLVEAAANLFGHLHRLDEREVASIAVAPIPAHGLGRAINDRLQRASAPRLQN